MTVKSSATFDVPAVVLYKSFLDQSDLTRMTRSPATSCPVVGGDWSLYGGSVRGKYQVLEEGKRIVQSWRFSNWADSNESTVEILFEPRGSSSTVVNVTQSNIPVHDKFGNAEQDKLCQRGWEDKYWNGIATMLGYPRNKDEESCR